MKELSLTADELVNKLLALPAEARLSLFDSCGRTLGGSRYLIAGINPLESFEFYCKDKKEAENALQFLDEKLKFYRQDGKSISDGFCAATFGYDLGLLLENITPRRKEFNNLIEPTVTLAFYKEIFVHDYITGRTYGSVPSALADGWRTHYPSANADGTDLFSNFTKDAYLTAVEKIRKHIALGNIYQANLTQQFRVELNENLTPEMIFARLRRKHPAPFAAFLRRADDAVVSASPERFLQISRAGEVITSPIKGTRRRGKTAEEDAFLRQQLEMSAKDRAENVMIVDLLRNDIGRVCEFNSVKVEKLCEIEEHPTLFHLVSTIKGQLRKDANVSDLIKATFPCGSITGAPKIRAMQILDEIETAPRGLSMGAVGYFGFDGAADLNVAIRTITIKNQTATFNVGGGIVFDSEPQAEFDESLLKAQALLKAVGAN